MSKKNLALGLALLLLFSVAPGVAQASESVTKTVKIADQSTPVKSNEVRSISQKEALEILRDTFPNIILNMNNNWEVEYQDDYYDARSLWSIRLREHGNSMRPSQFVFTAQVDAQTGEIIRMDYNPPKEFYRNKDVTLTREQAFTVAESFLAQNSPDKIQKLKVKEQYSSTVYQGRKMNMFYSFRWERLIDGASVDWDGINIGVDAVTGIITNYSYRWHDSILPEFKAKISKEDLTEELMTEIGIYPTYVYDRKIDGASNNDLTLVYKLNTDVYYFDCKTGEPLNFDGTKLNFKDICTYDQAFKLDDSDNGQNSSVATDQTKISFDIAKKAAKDFFNSMGMPGEVRKSGSGSSGGPENYKQEYWCYSLKDKQDDPNAMTVDIDAYTGKLKGFDRYNRANASSEQMISYTQALEKAQTIINKLNPEKKDLLALRKTLSVYQQGNSYNFTFSRLINGIPFRYGGISVEVDKFSGNINRYNVDWPPVQVESGENLISREAAVKVMKSDQFLNQTYLFPRDEGSYSGAEGIPAYRISERNMVNAKNGQLLDWYMNEKGAPSFNEMCTGHWAAPSLSLLKENGLLSDEGIDPNETINRRQILKLLLIASGTGEIYSDELDFTLNLEDITEDDSDYEIIKRAVNQRIISNQGKFEPNMNMSREDLAVWLVNSLGYQEVAQMKNAIDTPVKDAYQMNRDKANYVGLAYGLGLLSADEAGCLRPKDDVTWAQMATIAGRLATM